MIPILLAFGEITHFEGRGGGEALLNKSRYGCASSAKPRRAHFPQKPYAWAKKVPKNLMTG